MSLRKTQFENVKAGHLTAFIREWWESSPFAADILPSLLSIVVGAITGIAAYIFIELINFFEKNSHLLREDYGALIGIPLLMIAGLVAGLMIQYLAPEIQGGGVPHVMEAISLRRGRVRRRVAPTKMAASSITIGTGGSVGREGPIVQIGASIGSTIGRWFQMADEDVSILVASGAAGGISAVFNTPIAGAMFAIEIILGRFTRRNLKAVIISAVSASVVARSLLGVNPAFRVPAYPLDSVYELPVYVLLGLLCAVGSIVFVRLLYFGERHFEEWKMPIPVRTALGMGLTGLVGLLLPEVLGSGLEFIGEAIADNIDLTLGLIGALFFLKMVATILTLGTGNPGGDLAPTLFLGAVIGSFIGRVFHDMNPDVFVNPGAFALVGMAAFFAGAARAPITAILLVLELSNDYRLIVPLMLGVVISTILSDLFLSDSIYTLKLTLRGIRLERGQDIDLLQSVTVRDVMTTNYEPIPPETTLIEVMLKINHSHHHGFPIVDDTGHLMGIVTLSDVERAQAEEKPFYTPVTEFATTRNIYVAYPDDPIYLPLRRMNVYGIGRLPVIARNSNDYYLGMVRRQDILKAYDVGMMRKSIEVHRNQRFQLRNLDNASFVEFQVDQGAPMVGHTLKEFPCSDQCLILSIRRNGENIIAHGDTMIEVGDMIVAYIEAGTEGLVADQFSVNK